MIKKGTPIDVEGKTKVPHAWIHIQHYDAHMQQAHGLATSEIWIAKRTERNITAKPVIDIVSTTSVTVISESIQSNEIAGIHACPHRVRSTAIDIGSITSVTKFSESIQMNETAGIHACLHRVRSTAHEKIDKP